MLTAEENEAFTQVGPETPMGRLLRWYWHPIAAATQLDENPVQSVHLLGESLVLFRDRKGRLSLISDTCAHRRVNLVFGIPEDDGLRCPYHGWLYDGTGQCLEMPSEPTDSTFPSRVKIASYPVQELAGLIFAYLGPDPAPLLPNWDIMVTDGVLRDIGLQVVQCNWLQMQENDLDPAHLQWLHGYFSNYALERLGRPDLIRQRPGGMVKTPITDKRDWQFYDQGVMNYDKSPEGLRMVRPSIFPNMNSFGSQFMFRVPMDDKHTLHVTFTAYPPPPGETADQDKVPYYIVPPSVTPDGLPIWAELDNNGGQDIMAWVAQGDIVDRSQEKLGESDRGVIIFRELLRRQLRIVEDGGEPMNVFRDPEKNVSITIPPRNGAALEWPGNDGGFMRRITSSYKHSPVVTDLVERLKGKEALEPPVH
jgi:5,5'-dehydrodivanillate O-demethylase